MKAKRLGMLALGLLANSMVTDAGVVVGDREWRQPIETSGFTWSQVASVCNRTSGTCSGSLNGVSFDGWTWASIEDVQELFEQLIQPDSIQFPTITSESNYVAVDDPDIQAALGPNGFTPLATDFGPVRTGGYARSPFVPAIPSYYFAPYLLLDATPEHEDFACLACAGADTETGNFRGNWLHRPASVDALLEGLLGDATAVGPGSSLANKIEQAQAYYASSDVGSACSMMADFIHQVIAQAGKKRLDDSAASALIEQAGTIRRVMGCG